MRLRSNAALRGSVSVKKQVESISAEQGISERRNLLMRDSLSHLYLNPSWLWDSN